MSPAQVKSDFVNVRLSDAGRAFAGPKGSVRIANAHMNYKFSGDAAQRVLTSEWTKILSIEKVAGNKPMFEIAEPSAPAVTKTVAETQPAAPAGGEKQEK